MSTIARITLGQYDQMIAAGVFNTRPRRERLEFIEGELREMSPIGFAHEMAVDLLARWSMKHTPEETVHVRVQNSLAFPAADSCPEPDLAWVVKKTYTTRPTAADVLLIIEVADSSLVYDRGEKAALYARAGIADYWIVNLVDRCLLVLRQPSNGEYRQMQIRVPGDEVRPLATPELAFSVARLFE